MSRERVNINADLGEGAGQDAELMPLLSSCNIACGGHAGDRDSIIETIELARKFDVKIGAHPSYPDREHFGRIRPNIDDLALEESLADQLELFFHTAKKIGVDVHHVKAHGALYNDASADGKTAQLFLNTLKRLGITTKIYAPFESKMHGLVSDDYQVIYEAFIDRAYNEDLSLVNRSHKDALHQTPERAWKQLYELYFLEEVTTASGIKTAIQADTFCIHGDHPGAVRILRYLREELAKTIIE